jgi:hypothetical protein
LIFRCFGLVLNYRSVRQRLFQRAGTFLVHPITEITEVARLNQKRCFFPIYYRKVLLCLPLAHGALRASSCWPARHQHRRMCAVGDIALAEPSLQIALLPPRQSHVGEDQDREQHQRQQGWPLDHEAADQKHEAGVLRMAHKTLQTSCDQLAPRKGTFKRARGKELAVQAVVTCPWPR